MGTGEDFKDGCSREGQLSAKLLWHGCRAVPVLLDICGDGFDRAQAVNCAYGKGCYFAASATYSDGHACAMRLPGEDGRKFKAMLLATVLVGELVQGTCNMCPP